MAAKKSTDSRGRRDFLKLGALTAIGGPLVFSSDEARRRVPADSAQEGYRPVVTPNGATLPFKMKDGKKVFHLIAEEVDHEFSPGLKGKLWGYNGRVHGPTIEAVEGDHVRIYVTNRLPVATTVHWHGLSVPNGMDGVGGLSQRSIEPKETFKYEFTIEQHGTFMYHSHHDEMTQMAMGLMGMFVVHPKKPIGPPPDRDYVFLLSEWAMKPGMLRPDPNEMMDFNVLTLNARVYPGTEPIVAQKGERVRIRFGNLSAMDHHPMHLHAYAFEVVETDGGVVPPSARFPETTVLCPVGTTRTIEFVASRPGDWALHCHMTHHVMTQMGHGVPNLVGLDQSDFDRAVMKHVPQKAQMTEAAVTETGGDDTFMPKNSTPMMGSPGPFGYITMGGMFTILKVREKLDGPGDPGWYENPEGTVAEAATDEEMAADGIMP